MEDKETTEKPQDQEILEKNEEVVAVPHAIVVANSLPHGQDGK